jgi:hypothetical protein
VLDFRYFDALPHTRLSRYKEVLGERHEKVGKIREQLAYWGSPE